MSTEKTWQTHCTSSVDTEAFGQQLGERLRGGEVIELVSDLGGGKTTFVRGLARGAGSTEHVASPTFTLSRQYRAPKYTLVHFDLYRLAELGSIADEIREYVHDSAFVVVGEWAESLGSVLPAKRIVVHIRPAADETRVFTCTFPEQLAYVFEGVAATC